MKLLRPTRIHVAVSDHLEPAYEREGLCGRVALPRGVGDDFPHATALLADALLVHQGAEPLEGPLHRAASLRQAASEH